MSLVARAVAACVAAAGAWCALGSLAVFSTSSAAQRVGVLPPWWVLALLLASALAVAIALRGRPVPSRLLPLQVLPLFLLPWLPVGIPPALLLLTGRLGFGLVSLVAVACALSGRVAVPRAVRAWPGDPRRAPIVAASGALILFLWGAQHLQGMVPGGDEPHYLVITQSLLLDGDLRIENNHAQRDYAPYFGGTLRPDYLRRGQDLQIYSIHAPGISALVLPAFALGGYWGAVIFLAILCAAGTGLAWWLAWRVTADASAAWFGWASVTMAVPFTIQAFSIYPDATASVVVLTGVAALVLPVNRPIIHWLLQGAALALLPWLHTRHSVLAGVLGAFIAWRLVRARSVARLAAFAAIPLIGAAAWFAHFWWIYGTFSPSAPYGGVRNTTSFSFLPVTIPGLLFDQQFGLFATAPALLVACLGLGVLAWRRPSEWAMAGEANGRWLALQLLVLLCAYATASGTYRMWWAGSSSPARFLVPLVLPLSVPAAAFWAGARSRAWRVVAGGTLAVTVLLTSVFLGVDHGRLAFNVRDGYALIADWLSPTADLPNALPSLFRDAPRVAARRTAAWLAVLFVCWAVVAVVDRARRPSRGALALAALWAGSLGVLAAAATSWPMGGQPRARLREASSQVVFLQQLDERSRYVGARLAPALSLVSPVEEARRFRLGNVHRRPLAAGDVLLLTDVPAGEYRFKVDPVPSAGVFSVAIGRGPVYAEWPAGSLGPGMVLDLPVRARAVVLRADEAARSTPFRAWAEPVSFNGGVGAIAGRALVGARYGNVSVFALDADSYVESGGVWTTSTARAAFTVAAPTRGQGRVTVAVSGGPAANACQFIAGGWSERVEIGPEEWRELALPLGRDGRARVTVKAERDFTPALAQPGNGDERRLGCRVEFK